jgi:hypothetical protein
MSLDLTHDKLGWPSPNEVRNPPGEGARVFADLAHAKIESALAARSNFSKPSIGVLARNPHANDTESPLAVVAEFQGQATEQTLRELHRLAWNFSHAPTVVTIEPHLLRVWTCCEPPESDRFLSDYVIHEISTNELGKDRLSDQTKRALQVLHWANLVSGQFFRDRPGRFPRDKRADHMLLNNLRHLREMLRTAGLTNDDICHDLLARVIFMQFLFDRRDSSGNSALNANKLTNLRQTGVLKDDHQNFASILDDYEDAYRLFDWLNDRFNGDLFPSKGSTKQEREHAWLQEKRHVKSRHFALLRDFVRGDLEMPTGQLCLWPAYSFDAIPLEFISSIYEAFVTERARSEGIYYTPPHLVDFVLDRVLPWGGNEWDLKILDPACGSGVFLVKAFQRLIHRWKNFHPGEPIRAETLRRLLEKNLFGVDKDPHAVRVASFSLYLAMCDEIDPKHYWTQVHFPPMRQRRLIHADFFEEGHPGFRTKADAEMYDLVVGNAPWGEELLTKEARDWAGEKTRQWPVANKGIGTLFLPKAASLTKPTGRVSMIQSASSLLFNRSRRACDFRKKFFTTFRVDEVVNLSALRFKVFNQKTRATQKSVAPSCIVTFASVEAANERFPYISPKYVDDFTDEFDVIVEPLDIKPLHPRDAAESAEVWSTLMWGQRRDQVLVRRLMEAPSLLRPGQYGPITHREGVIFGDRSKYHSALENRRILTEKEFPSHTSVFLNADRLEKLKDPRAHSRDSTDFRAFELPQIIIKQAWRVSTGRFEAALTESTEGCGALCTQSYISAHSEEKNVEFLEAACLSYNSSLAVYFLLLTSGRFASYRPEPLVEELLRVPVPSPQPGLLTGASTPELIDSRIRRAFDFKDAEWVLVEDLFDVTLADFKGDEFSAGRLRTRRKVGVGEEPQLRRYCEYFVRVLKAGFGNDKEITATIFQDESKNPLPYRLVAFHLNKRARDAISIASLDSPALLEELEALNQRWLAQKSGHNGSIFSQRVVRIYDDHDGTPTIYILKPDACRYWTRSMGLHDADEVSADLARWKVDRKAAAQ